MSKFIESYRLSGGQKSDLLVFVGIPLQDETILQYERYLEQILNEHPNLITSTIGCAEGCSAYNSKTTPTLSEVANHEDLEEGVFSVVAFKCDGKKWNPGTPCNSMSSTKTFTLPKVDEIMLFHDL